MTVRPEHIHHLKTMQLLLPRHRLMADAGEALDRYWREGSQGGALAAVFFKMEPVKVWFLFTGLYNHVYGKTFTMDTTHHHRYLSDYKTFSGDVHMSVVQERRDAEKWRRFKAMQLMVDAGFAPVDANDPSGDWKPNVGRMTFDEIWASVSAWVLNQRNQNFLRLV